MRSRALAFVVVGMLGGMSACQPLYGGKPEKLAKPPTKKRPPEAPVVAAEIKYVEDCGAANFHDDPKKAPPKQPAIAQKLTEDGDAAIAASGKIKEPLAAANAIKDAIDKYANALRKDPYNANATLKLAIAYDMVYRKGCALAMLKRLATLEKNLNVSPDATRVIDSITDNTSLFKGYHKDAVTAAGR